MTRRPSSDHMRTKTDLLTRKSAVPLPQPPHPPQPLPSPVALPAAPRDSFSALLEHLTAVVWEAEPATLRLTFVSRHAEELLDYPLARWLEEPEFWAQVVH